MHTNTVTTHSNFHWNVYTEIIIDAPKDKLRSILMDFEHMPQWSKIRSKNMDERND
jgi:uncharacterized membrane protein